MKKYLIAVDGLDASGKKTQTELLAKAFGERNVPYRCISFPTYDKDFSAGVNMYLSGRFGDDPSAVNPYAASSFYAADRYCSYMLDWKKDYDAGKVIIANRYTSANAVHQLSKLPEEKCGEFLDWLNDYEFAKMGIPRPDAVIYLCLPPELSVKLLNKRCEDTGAEKDIHEKNFSHLKNSYRAALYSSEKLGWIKIDCSDGEEIRTVESINKEIIERIKEKLPDIGL